VDCQFKEVVENFTETHRLFCIQFMFATRTMVINQERLIAFQNIIANYNVRNATLHTREIPELFFSLPFG
jgi:hypothetical protein